MDRGVTTGRSTTVLIAGAGIAGPALAYWLAESGRQPTLVEHAPALRTGGYMLDLWGPGYDLAERMGILPALRERAESIQSIRFVNAGGRKRTEIGASILRRTLGDRFLSVPRGELAQVLFGRVESRAETVFDDTVTGLEEDENGVEVRFRRGRPRRFDLVVGADGLHSAVRALAMGTEHRWFRYLGYAAAAFSAPTYSRRDPSAYVSYASPGRQISRYALPLDRTAFLLVFAVPEPIALHSGELETDKRLLQAVFGQEAWIEMPEILSCLAQTEDLYYDAVTQIVLPSWSRGRTVLLGDAAHCPSLLAGEGAALAMLGAMVLSRELDRARGDHRAAFAGYERTLRPFIERRQRAARAFASSFAPRTRIGLAARDLALDLMKLPVLGEWIARRLLLDDAPLPGDPESPPSHLAV